MFTVLLVVCAARSVYGIIVKDPVPTGEEYKYWYEVQDPTTGDSKRLHEVRQGDAVSGSYSVLDPDGTRRTVHYTADPYTGFKAVLVQEPITTHAIPQGYTPLENLQSVFPQRFQHAEPNFDIQPRRTFKGYQRRKFFTPAREIPQEKHPINGFYFEPNNKYT
ncbi:insect cuticle protein domain-containing protein [Phthorimaea operculella]|nr:insect cuticle protein domain-containing protein [Phthorimaea operculella]